MSRLLDTLQEVDRRYSELDRLLADPEISTDPQRLQEIGRERAELAPIMDAYTEYKQIETALTEAEEMVTDPDPELAAMADEERRSLIEQRETLIAGVKALLVPKDPNDQKNVIVEIRAGTGGDEAALFAADLFRMYSRFAERHR